MAETVNELTSVQITTHIQDLSGIDLSSIDYLLATLRRDDPCQILNSRVAQNINGANGGTFSSGLVTINLVPADNVLLSTDDESHTLHLEWGYDSDSNSTLTDPFTTTSGDETVSVAHTSHGLTVGEHVTFVDADSVGGLNLNGVKVVATVESVNEWTFEHAVAATSSVAGSGGTPAYFVNPKVGREDIPFTVKAFVKVPTE